MVYNMLKTGPTSITVNNPDLKTYTSISVQQGLESISCECTVPAAFLTGVHGLNGAITAGSQLINTSNTIKLNPICDHIGGLLKYCTANKVAELKGFCHVQDGYNMLPAAAVKVRALLLLRWLQGSLL